MIYMIILFYLSSKLLFNREELASKCGTLGGVTQNGNILPSMIYIIMLLYWFNMRELTINVYINCFD